jgi:hypothetical protein
MSTPPTATPDATRRLDLAILEVAGIVSGLADRVAAVEAHVADVQARLLTLANQRRVARFSEAGSHPLYSSRKRVQK